MKYLLDTNQIINYLRNNAETVEKLAPLFKEGTAIGVITIAEYLRGAYRSKNTKKDIEAFQEFLFEKKGMMMPHFDLLIASTAINMTLL